VAITLRLTKEDFLTLLSDNVELAHGLFKTLFVGDPRHGVVHGTVPVGSGDRPLGGSTQAIDRAVVLQQNPLFARATNAQLLHLAAATRDVTLAQGQVLFNDSDQPAVYIVMAGTLTVTGQADDSFSAYAGDMVGAYEALSGIPAEHAATVTEQGWALSLDRHGLFDVLADQAELLHTMVGALVTQRTSMLAHV